MREKEPKQHIKTKLALITYGILLFVALQNISAIKRVSAWIFAILEPVAYGICIAFVINLFMNIFKRKIFYGLASSKYIWVDAPERTVWFLVFIFALQQIEGQFIYPKVVGDTIGLPGFAGTDRGDPRRRL